MSVGHAYSRQQVAPAFGDALRALRRSRGISQDQLAKFCHFDRTYPSLLERGLRTPTLTMIFKLARALDLTPERLVSETEARLSQAEQP